jgi:tRNA 2-thiouridine synthesizing protein C
MTDLLIISSSAPYYSSAAQDAIEAALAASNVDLSVSFVFTDNGLFQLLEAQDGKALGKKSVAKQIKAMPLYDIGPIYYLETDLSSKHLEKDAISTVATGIDALNFAKLCSSSSSILRF